MKTWLRSLAGRVTMVTAAVAVLAVLVTGTVGFPLIRAAAVEQARSELSRQADAFAVTPVASQALDLRERHLLGPADYELSAVSTDGTVSGAARPYLSADEIQRVLSGGKTSQTVNREGSTLLLEARGLKRGGAIVLTRSLADVYAASALVLQRTLLALAAGLLIAVLAGTLLARRMSRPLVRTAAAARRMAGGERGVQLVPAGVTEVRAVGEAVNTLDHALLASEGRQREFLLSVSHEIRTPLTAMRGYAEALEDGLVLAAADVAAVGRTLAAETDRLDVFVNDLLELARLEADDFAVETRPVEITALLHQVEETWRARAAQSGVRLQLIVPVPEQALMVLTDAQRLRQILDGLVENALRVTPQGKPLRLSARLESGGGQDVVAIDVRDNGPGLTAEDAAVAFDRGVLYRRYAGQRPVGSGLGLSIAARLAERLGATLTVELGEPPELPDSGTQVVDAIDGDCAPRVSDGVSAGACFCIRLPGVGGSGGSIFPRALVR
ncbi:HAMP domain-containing sensor histidine kinase [Paenarthrobacter sp. PH39-S1]|uniref:sensor histidine kinase n=1 Tax=Paenarthrobacter sp. PH39-S1 TaxID=3046204 RepID=UPI0024B9CA7D|nr:HAMP domain-containing sensor histidine kinase [Paenarthrobacter sp. PH39-S1]MDJ0357634.1 HAMP domain-containing sensor histidine kinase [Paenarthrobacter sp. PH39-S1]